MLREGGGGAFVHAQGKGDSDCGTMTCERLWVHSQERVVPSSFQKLGAFVQARRNVEGVRVYVRERVKTGERERERCLGERKRKKETFMLSDSEVLNIHASMHKGQYD
jgi:hypothetical protein